jgi:hypothetical protein
VVPAVIAVVLSLAAGPTVVARGFDSPTHVTAPSSQPGRLYVVEQAGVIKVVDRGRVRAQPFLDIRDLVSSGGERGLLSIAFPPGYACVKHARRVNRPAIDCLISHSKNSRLSNFMPEAKKEYYRNNTIDSLKQHLMMKSQLWDTVAIFKHYDAMSEVLLRSLPSGMNSEDTPKESYA